MSKASEKKIESEDKILKLISERYTRAAKDRAGYINQWDECRMFYQGDHWLERRGSGLQPIRRQPWEVRMTVNMLPARVEGALSIFLGQKPIITATPQTDEEADRESAKVSSKLLYYLWEHLDLQDETLQELLLWANICGDGFIRPLWDSSKGKEYNRPVGELDPNLPPEEQEIETESVREGDIVVDVLAPYSVSFEPGARKLEESAWILVTETPLRSHVEAKFETEITDAEAGKDDNDSERSMMTSALDGGKVSEERVILDTMYELPSGAYPQGRIVYALRNRVLLVEEELPFGEYPIIHFQDIKLPGQLLGTSKLSQSIPLQAGYNRLRSQIIENRNMMSRPQLIAPEGSVAPGSFTNKPGSIIWWNPIMAKGQPPKLADIHHTPPSHIQELGLFTDELNGILSQHEASQGQSSGNITSGRQAAIFRQADNTRFLLAVRRFERGLAKLAKQMLRLLKKNMAGERTIQILGIGSKPEFMSFQANDINDEANLCFDIASQMPWAPDAMRQESWALFKEGLISKEELMQRLRQPSRDTVYAPSYDHRINAQIENEMLWAGKKISPMPTDDHAVHIELHTAEINKPEIREQIHLDRERFQQEQAQMQQASQQLMAMGAPTQGMPQPAPTFIQVFLEHLEEHRKAVPPPAPPAALTKINLNGELDPQQAAQIASGGAPQPAIPGGEGETQPVPNKSQGSPESMPGFNKNQSDPQAEAMSELQ